MSNPFTNTVASLWLIFKDSLAAARVRPVLASNAAPGAHFLKVMHRFFGVRTTSAPDAQELAQRYGGWSRVPAEVWTKHRSKIR